MPLSLLTGGNGKVNKHEGGLSTMPVGWRHGVDRLSATYAHRPMLYGMPQAAKRCMSLVAWLLNAGREHQTALAKMR